MKLLKFIKIFAIFLSLTAILCVLGGVAFLGTDMGKSALVKVLNKYQPIEDASYEILSINSFSPLSLTLSKLEFKQGGNLPWLQAHNLDLEVQIKDLLFQKKLTGNLTVKLVKLNSLPPSSEKISTESSPDFLAFFKKQPENFPLKLDLDAHILLRKIEVDETVMGEKVDFLFKNAHVTYDRNANFLNLPLDFTMANLGEPLHVSALLKGKMDDLSLIFTLNDRHFNFRNVPLDDLKVAGEVRGFPFHTQGLLKSTFKYKGEEGFFEVPAFTLDSENFRFENLILKGFSSHIHASGSYKISTQEGRFDFVGDSKDFKPLGDLFNLSLQGQGSLKGHYAKEGDKNFLKFSLQGRKWRYKIFTLEKVSGDVEFEGDFRQPTLKSTLSIATFKLPHYVLSDLNLQARLIKGKGPLELKAKGKNIHLNLQSVFNFTPANQTLLVKKFNAQFDQHKVDLLQAFTVKYADADKTLLLSPARLKFLEDAFVLKGRMRNQNLDFTAQGKINLAALSKFFMFTDDPVRGIIDANVQIKGTASRPLFNGNLLLHKGYYENSEYGLLLNNINLNIRLSQNCLKILHGTATDKRKGSLDLKGLYNFYTSETDIHLNMSHFYAAHTDSFKLFIDNANLNLKGKASQLKMTGEFNIGESLYDLEADSLAEIPTLNVEKPEKNKSKKAQSPDFFDALKIDVMIHFFKPLLIKGKGITSYWKGHVNAFTKGQSHLLNGKIKLIKGNIKFLGNELKLKEGVIHFDNHPNNTPFITTKAVVEKHDINAYVQIIGRLTHPKIILSSDPALSQEEVLARLLFGKESAHLSPVEAIQLARSLDSLHTLGEAAGMVDMFAGKIGLDRIGFGSTEEGGNALKIEKKLFDRVTVELSQGVGEEGTAALVELEVTPKVSLEGEIGTAQSSQGLGVNYKWDY